MSLVHPRYVCAVIPFSARPCKRGVNAANNYCCHLLLMRSFRRDSIGISASRTGPFTRSDTVASSSTWSNCVVGKVSPWIQLDSSVAQVRRASELVRVTPSIISLSHVYVLYTHVHMRLPRACHNAMPRPAQARRSRCHGCGCASPFRARILSIPYRERMLYIWGYRQLYHYRVDVLICMP